MCQNRTETKCRTKNMHDFESIFNLVSVAEFQQTQHVILRAVSHIHRFRTETVTATELHLFVFGRPFTYEPNRWTKSKKMPVQFGLISLSDSRNTITIQIVPGHCLKFVVFIVALVLVPQKSVVRSIVPVEISHS